MKFTLSFLQPNGAFPPMSQGEISEYQWVSNLLGGISTFFGFLTILMICRYTTNSMITYKFHLLNMAINILLCDLTLSVLTIPHTIFPPNGEFLGKLRKFRNWGVFWGSFGI